MFLSAINKKLVCFYYHLNCRHINVNVGDIKLGVMLMYQNTFDACLHIKSHQNDANRRDLTCFCLQSIKSSYVLLSPQMSAYQ